MKPPIQTFEPNAAPGKSTPRVPAGYKQTEVGVIPEDWDIQPLGNVVTFLDGQRRPVKSADRAKMRGSIPYYGASGIVDYVNDYLFDDDLILLGEDGENILSRNLPLAFRVSGKIWVNNHAHVLKPNNGTSIGFLTEYLESLNYEDLNSGTAQPKLNKEKCLRIPVAIPTLAEQEAIATALSDADALIDSLEQLIAKKRLLKQGAMQDLLTGKKRLPGFEGEWVVKTFGEIFNYLPTATNSRSDLEDVGDTYYIHYGDIHTRFHSHLDFSTTRPPRIARSRCRNAALLKNGDWVMADASEDYDGVGKTIEIQGLDNDTDAIAGLHTFALREKTPTYAPGFKGHLGNLKSLHEQYLRVATGMKVYGVSKSALRDLELPVPTLPEQTAIAAILSDMDAGIAALEAKLSKARQLKQGMMQELLTGKTRLV